jgi:hypothetical protein
VKHFAPLADSGALPEIDVVPDPGSIAHFNIPFHDGVSANNHVIAD